MVFSDESNVNLFDLDGKQYCRRRVREGFEDRNVAVEVKYI